MTAATIAYVLPWSIVGGGEIATLRLAQAIQEDGRFHCLAFCPGPETDVAHACERASLDTVAYTPAEFSYRRAWPYLRHTARLARELKKRHVDLVHCSDLMGAYHAAPAARLAGVPVVCHIRSNFPDDLPRHHKVPIAAVERFIFVSRATWRNFDRIYRVPAERGAVIYDWAPDGAVPADADARRRIRAELGIPEQAPVFGMIARVAPPKDFETLLRATAQVAASHPDVRLVLVGEYRYPEECRAYWMRLSAMVDELQLRDRVVWTGFRRDVAALICATDSMVLCTHNEGFGLVVLEAMANGRPVIATRVGGIPEIIADGGSGLLHEPGDVAGLADHMRRLLDDRQLAHDLAERGREHARTAFTRTRTVNEVRTVYDRMLGRPKPSIGRGTDRRAVIES